MNRQETTLLGCYGSQNTDFILEKHVRTLGKWCFSRHRSERFYFEEGSVLETIEEGAFYQSNFVEIEIPSTVVAVKRNCFAGRDQSVSKLKKIHFRAPSRLAMFAEEMFRGSALKSITIPSSVIELGAKCFKKSVRLVTVAFENDSSLVCIRRECFSECVNLVSFGSASARSFDTFMKTLLRIPKCLK